MEEYKIGETFNYNGIKLIVTTNSNGDCNDCYFNENRKCMTDNSMGECYKTLRKDRKNVIFKEIK